MNPGTTQTRNLQAPVLGKLLPPPVDEIHELILQEQKRLKMLTNASLDKFNKIGEVMEMDRVKAENDR